MRRARLGKKHPGKNPGQAHLRTSFIASRGMKSITPKQSMRLHLSVGETQPRTVKRGKGPGHGVSETPTGAHLGKTRFTCTPLRVSRRGVRFQGARRAGETQKKVKTDTAGPFRGINSFPRTWPRSVRFHGRFCRKRRAFHDFGSLFGQKRADTCH